MYGMFENASAVTSSRGRFGRRGMTMPFAIIILVVVILVVGGAGDFGLQGTKPTTQSVTVCSPGPCSGTTSKLNDVTLFVPYTVGFGQTYSTVAAQNSVPATVGVTGGETISSFAVNWAPGATTTASTGSLSYKYATPGLYTLSATATTPAGVVHTGLGQLVALKVNPSATAARLGLLPLGNGEPHERYWRTVPLGRPWRERHC